MIVTGSHKEVVVEDEDCINYGKTKDLISSLSHTKDLDASLVDKQLSCIVTLIFGVAQIVIAGENGTPHGELKCDTMEEKRFGRIGEE